mmetsp:Transcript_5696/g.7913  ORF Transcript_5696/g.7913 Transcript_5696/m.7913 type:complete len:126 (+) Transcript_5696:181-558(+)
MINMLLFPLSVVTSSNNIIHFHVAAVITSKTYIPMSATIFSSLLFNLSRVTAINSNLYSRKFQSPAKHRIIPPLLQLLFTANIPMSPTIFSRNLNSFTQFTVALQSPPSISIPTSLDIHCAHSFL